MSFLDNISKKVSQTSQEAIKKTKNFADTTKLNTQIDAEHKAIHDVLLQIGKKYFDDNRTSPGEGYENQFALIEASFTKIADYQDQIRRIKGIVVCLNCGAENADEAKFCSTCGARLPEHEHAEAESAPEGGGVRRCPSCGAELASDAAFCTNCGAKLE